MKFIHVNNRNANTFKNQAQDKDAFVKYYSPTCPACIAMEDEWDNMCKDIDEKYNTDIILAQMDPTGMKELEPSEIHTDVDYVPTLVILKHGKKHKEYNGQKNKDDMIKFLMEEQLISPKMTMGGKKIKSKKSKKSSKSKKSFGKKNKTKKYRTTRKTNRKYKAKHMKR